MSGKKKIRFIINPISGIGKKNQLPDLIERYLDHEQFEYEIRLSEYQKHARSIAWESSQEGFDIVCAIGGDGSVHEIGTALIGTPTKLAIIPAGSGNGLARHLAIPLKVIDAIHCINEYKIIAMDTIRINDTPFIGFGGFGFDALIAKRFDESNRRGLTGYIKVILKEFFQYKRGNIHIKTNNTELNGKYFLCSIANSSEFGNGFCISPKSKVEDGSLELCLLESIPIWGVPKLLTDIFLRKADQNKHIKIIPFRELFLELESNIAHFDGEPFEVENHLKIEVKPKSLNILVGKKYDEIH